MKRILGWLFSLVVFSSCEKAISFIPAESAPTLVVEASIENGRPPVVVLSKSLNYFSAISPEILAGSFVRNARVLISNGEKTHRLKEYERAYLPGYNTYYYSIDSSDLPSSFNGELGKTYSLSISAEGKEYSSTTTIPPLSKMIDSLSWQASPDNKDSTNVMLMATFSDPPGLGNYVRYFTKTDYEPDFLPGLNSVYDDQIIDGKTYTLQLERGVDRNTDIDFDTYSFFAKGDSVTVKFCNIDKATFDFWRTMEYSYSSIGNPFSSPSKVLGNIGGGALGYFGGYAAQYIGLRIPE